MRNDSHKWDAPDLRAEAALLGDQVQITPKSFQRLTLLSGVDVAQRSALPLVAWPDVAPDTAFALSLRRDRLLEIEGPQREDGWSDGLSCLVSDMTSGYSGFEVSGAGALALLSRGGPVSLSEPSKSVARLLFGLPALLFRLGPDRYGMLVASSFATAAWRCMSEGIEAQG